MNSPLAERLSLGTALGRRLVTQAVKLSPVNLRPLLGIRPDRNAKAIALVASGYARLAVATGDASAAAQASRWLRWLEQHPAEGTTHLWGYNFPVQTRVFRYPRNAPNTIASSFAAHALLDGAELLGDDKAGVVAGAAAEMLLDRMFLDRSEGPYFKYVEHDDELIHNANVLACSVCARAARVLGREDLADPARRALMSTLEAQRADGAWPYAEDPAHAWVDNYHTAYVLQSLARSTDLDVSVSERVRRGARHWERTLFLRDGTPKYYDDRLYPLDAHNYAEAVECWVSLGALRDDAPVRAARAAQLLVERMLDPQGYVRFQRWWWFENRVPLVRWTTAPSFRALAGLLLLESGRTLP